MTGKCHLSSDRVLTSVRKKSGALERVSKSRVKVSHRSVVPSSSPSMQIEIGYGNQLAKPSSHHTVKTTTTCGVHLGKVERHPRGYEKEREREKNQRQIQQRARFSPARGTGYYYTKWPNQKASTSQSVSSPSTITTTTNQHTTVTVS